MMRAFGHMPYNNMMDGGYWWVGMIMMIVQLLFWAGVIYLIYRLVKKHSLKSLATSSEKILASDPAMDLLRQRFAKGEIDVEEYNLRKKELEG